MLSSGGFLLLGVCVAMISASPANAASYSTFVGCSVSASAVPSHICHIGDEPGAFFESDTEVEYDVCVDFPGAETICADEQEAEADVLYVNAITTNIPGNHLVTWYVEGIEVASWTFRMDNPPAPAAPTPATPPPATAPSSKPAVALPTVLGCVPRGGGVTFVSHPRQCIEYQSPQQFHASEIWMTKLHWSAWGEANAVARGSWKHCGMGHCFSGPLKAVASRRVRTCGRYAYTRLGIQLIGINGRKYHYSLKLPAC